MGIFPETLDTFFLIFIDTLMKSLIVLLITFLLLNLNSKAQSITKTYLKNGNVYAQYDNADTRQITTKGIDSQPVLSNDKKFVIYLRTIKNTKEPEEGEEFIEETRIVKYDFSTSIEKILVQGCKSDGTGSSTLSYADSDQYPFSGICNITNIQLSPDGHRVYFQTSAWTVSNAIHYCFIPNGKIAFFSSGNLKGIDNDGNLVISSTGIEQGKGRYTQDWLFDKDGNELKAVSEKEF